jgi:hypothetical protein
MHPTSDDEFILEALEFVAMRHDSLLELVANGFDEDPLAALHFLQICGMNRFGHILSAVPPESSAIFRAQRDASIT